MVRVDNLAALLEKDALALEENGRRPDTSEEEETADDLTMQPVPSFADFDPSVTEEADTASVPAERWLHNYVDEYREMPLPEHLVKYARHRGSTLSYAAAKQIIHRTKRADDDDLTKALDSAVRKLEEMPRPAPVPLAAPSGMRGIFKSSSAYADYEPMDLESLPAGSVLLNVYDAGDEELVQKMNRWGTVNDNVLLGGVFHVGVQVYGEEWSFGENEVDGVRFSGIYACRPRCNWKHTYKCTIDLGATTLEDDEVSTLALSMKCSNSWQGVSYDEIHHNCLHFANALCNDLGVGGLPGWLDRFGRARIQVENLKDRAENLKGRARQVAKDIGSDLEIVKQRVRATSAAEVKASLNTSAAEVKASLTRWGTGLFAFPGKVIEAFKCEDSEEENEDDTLKKKVFTVCGEDEIVSTEKVVAMAKGD